ncbi:MAG: C10 family peptidase [Muribaculaceae bacterium]|nr:C10 family peptidase [Muribaculaceae bacterium]MBR0024076.1 C10 family peptidase [Muribaculaceae bacterium]
MKIFKRLTKLLSLALLLCMATQVQAADIDLATAKNVAKSFMAKQVTNGQLKTEAASNLKLVKAEPSVFNPKAVDYYIFNADKSYVVVAGDDQAPEILMYGVRGQVNLDKIPPAMQWLLNKYKFQIDGLKAGTLKPNGYTPKATTAVAPLTNANWDQNAPYWNHTPTSGSTHTYTGCPATSLSMCFYIFKWPSTYPALPKVSVSGGVTAPALSEKAADWANMLDEYTGPTNTTYNSTQAEAVSWLMRYVGQACNMQYTTSGSGAYDPDILEACHTFGYTDAQLLTLTSGYAGSNQNYTDAQWNEWMLAELHAGRPIEYLASDPSAGGHAFNVFGCDANGKYYVNWGWSGEDNGYCTLHNFTTGNNSTGQGGGSYTFNYGEAMIIGIAPPAGALGPQITVDPTTLAFEGYVGDTYTKTFTVTGANLEGNITITKQGASNITVSPTSITAANAANGVQVTVTYKPTAASNSNATITLASTNAESVTVNVTGTAEAKVPTITVDPTSLNINANLSSTVTKTINVTGLFLTNNITVTLNDNNNVFSVTPTTITAANAANGVPVTVSFNSATEGNFTGSITFTSNGAESKTVQLTASAAEGGNASDAYLNIAKYETIGEAGATVSGMSNIYKYTEYSTDACAWLTVCNYGALQADANQNWLETTGLKSYTNTWTASDIFLGDDAYFGSNTSYSIYSSGSQTFYVTNCTQAKAFVKGGGYSSSNATLAIYECTLNADGTLTASTTATDTKQGSSGVITSAALDASKIYKVVLTGGGSYPDLLEIGFKTDLDVTLPEIPTNVEADPSATTAKITWTPGENNDGWNLRWREYAQNTGEEEVTFSENFENGLSNWTLINTDGDSYNWQTVDLTSNFSGQFTAKDGSYVAMSRSWISSSVGAVTPDQWLISPQITDLGGTLKYYIMDDGNNYQENYRIYVSTSGKNISDFVAVTDDMLSPNSKEWTEVSIDLSSYKGQAGYIAFRHYNCTDKDFMFIDALSLTTNVAAQWNYVNGVTSPYTIEGLTPNTTYEVQVQGKYESATTGWTASTIFTTLGGSVAGDVNGDGDVTSFDITALYNYLLSGDMSDIVNGDQNGDGEITSADVTTVYSILLNAKKAKK